MELRHYSAKPFTFDPNFEYSKAGFYKPRGFWVSVLGEFGWKEWCHSEEFACEDLLHTYEVILKSDANILHLSTPEQIFALFPDGPSRSSPGLTKTYDWTSIQQPYDGLIISPYQWGCRLSVDWYYGWDCASGCIWNLDAIESVTEIKELCA